MIPTAALAAPAPGRLALEPLWGAPTEEWPDELRGGALPDRLHDMYGGDLSIRLRSDRPTIVANFVSTIDGVVAFGTDGSSGGSEVSGFHEPDRFVMGMLRAMADVVLIGAGTARAASDHEWTARHVHPPSARRYAEWRQGLGIARAQPTTVVVTASGEIAPDHPGLSAPDVPVVLVTTSAGASRLKTFAAGSNVRVEVAPNGDWIPPHALIETLDRLGARLVVCEGGPHLIADLLSADLLDELFLTLAPQLAGRDPITPRLSLVEGAAFSVAGAPWAELRSARRSADHLFLRYRLRPDGTQSRIPED